MDLRKCLSYLSALPQTGRHDFFKLLVLVLGFGSESFRMQSGSPCVLAREGSIHLSWRALCIHIAIGLPTDSSHYPWYWDCIWAVLVNGSCTGSYLLRGCLRTAVCTVASTLRTLVGWTCSGAWAPLFGLLGLGSGIGALLIGYFLGQLLTTSIGPYFITRLGSA